LIIRRPGAGGIEAHRHRWLSPAAGAPRLVAGQEIHLLQLRVSNIVAELEQMDLLTSHQPRRASGRGQPAVPVSRLGLLHQNESAKMDLASQIHQHHNQRLMIKMDAKARQRPGTASGAGEPQSRQRLVDWHPS
jgi:hypothetical protein